MIIIFIFQMMVYFCDKSFFFLFSLLCVYNYSTLLILILFVLYLKDYIFKNDLLLFLLFMCNRLKTEGEYRKNYF